MVLRLACTAVLSLLCAGQALAAIDLDDVIGMLEAGVEEQAIVRLMDSEDTYFVVTSEDLIDLKRAGASDAFIEEIMDRSLDTPRRPVVVRPGYDPYDAYFSIGIVYDPFDYYFAYWPYYYAYVAPFPFSWSWWYYGGPLHSHWCYPWSWRVYYYDRHWGSRTIWDRGSRDHVYHVPRYDLNEKELRHYGTRQAPEMRQVRNDAGDRRRWTDARTRRSETPRRSTIERSARERRGSEPRSGWTRSSERRGSRGDAQRGDRAPSYRRDRPRSGDAQRRSWSPARSSRGASSRAARAERKAPSSPQRPEQREQRSRR